jgi:hypothetical protein
VLNEGLPRQFKALAVSAYKEQGNKLVNKKLSVRGNKYNDHNNISDGN